MTGGRTGSRARSRSPAAIPAARPPAGLPAGLLPATLPAERLAPPPPPAVPTPSGRQPWLALLALGIFLLVLGGASFLLASFANAGNDRTFAAEILALEGRDPAAQAAELEPLVTGVERAVRTFWHAARETADLQRRLVATFDRALELDQAEGSALLERRAEPLIRRFERAASDETAALEDLSRAVARLREAPR